MQLETIQSNPICTLVAPRCNIHLIWTLCVDRTIWVGGSQDDDGTWNWADGSAWDFNNWSSGNPSSWQESCMFLDKSGAWRHQDCCPVAPTVLGFICGPRKDPSHGKCHRAACTQTCNQTLITSVDAAAPWEEIEAAFAAISAEQSSTIRHELAARDCIISPSNQGPGSTVSKPPPVDIFLNPERWENYKFLLFTLN